MKHIKKFNELNKWEETYANNLDELPNDDYIDNIGNEETSGFKFSKRSIR